MLGFYDYTVWLTYLSLMSAGAGILICLNGSGHPYLGVFFLLASGLCDAFDGRVARTKKNRTALQKSFGIQLDSLADIVAFGVLPACIGNAMIRVLPTLPEHARMRTQLILKPQIQVVLYFIMVWYILAALIRLAYFNATEEIRQQSEDGCRKFYEGLPVTASALIFPIILSIQWLTPMDITPIYFLALLIVAFLFVSHIRVPKPGLRGIMIMIGVGLADFVILILFGFIL